MSSFRRLVSALFALLLGAACDPDPHDAARNGDDTRGTAHGLADEAAAQRREAQQAVEEKLAELDRRLADAHAALRSAKDARVETRRRIVALEREGQQLRRRLETARRAGGRAWTEIGQAIDETMKEIETTLGASEDDRPQG